MLRYCIEAINMNTFIKKFSFFVIFSLIISGCSLVRDTYQIEQRLILDYLLDDLPLPESAEILKVPTVVLGTGDKIAGRVMMHSPESPAENLIFYGNNTVSAGWTLIQSTVGDQIILTYEKNGRYASIELTQRGIGFWSGLSRSLITVSIVHPESIGDQNPYLALKAKEDLQRAIASKE